MNQYLEQLKVTAKDPKVYHFKIKRMYNLISNTIRQLNPTIETKENLISVEQFDEADQQISSIRGVI